MKFLKFTVCVVSVFIFTESFALDVGDDAPDLHIARWIRGKPILDFPDSDEISNVKAIIVFFWATWNNTSPRLLEFASQMDELYKDDGLVIIGISKEAPSKVKNFLDKIENINFSLGIDDQAETYDEYMVATEGVPIFFIFKKDGELVWKGPPFEVDRVISRVLSGTFDIENQRKIERLRDDIKTSSHLFDDHNRVKIAHKTLKIDPTDEVAVNIIIDNYVRRKKIEKAINFIRNVRKKAKDNIFLQRKLFLIELGVIRSMNIIKAKNILIHLAKDSYATFYNNPKVLNEIAYIILQNLPFEIRPLKELLIMTERAVTLEKKRGNSSVELAENLQVLARVYYCLGWLSKAVTTQNQAVEILKDKKAKKTALIRENYYREVYNTDINKK